MPARPRRTGRAAGPPAARPDPRPVPDPRRRCGPAALSASTGREQPDRAGPRGWQPQQPAAGAYRLETPRRSGRVCSRRRDQPLVHFEEGSQQHTPAVNALTWLGELLWRVADTASAGNEHHRGGDELADDHRVVTGAADNAAVGKTKVVAGGFDGGEQPRVRVRGSLRRAAPELSTQLFGQRAQLLLSPIDGLFVQAAHLASSPTRPGMTL